MNFKTERIKDFYLLATEVENIFINEYLPQAPGDYVKVYLYALLNAKQQTEITHHGLAVQLGLKDSDVDLAWQYWERMGVVKRERRSDRSFFIIRLPPRIIENQLTYAVNRWIYAFSSITFSNTKGSLGRE